MNNLNNVGIATWDIIKLIFSLIWNHLPYFLFVEIIGFILGVIVSFLLIKFCKKKGVFSRKSKSKYSLFLNKAYKPLMFLSTMFFILTLTTHYALTHIVKKEIIHGTEEGFVYLEKEILHEESTRKQLYEMGKLALKGGGYVKDMNHAIAVSSKEMMEKDIKKEHGFIAAKLSRFMVSNDIEDRLLEIEKGSLFYLSSLAFEHAGINLGSKVSFETFENAFDKWLNLDFKNETNNLKEMISELVYKQVKPFVFSIFIPFLLIGLVFIILPIVHYLYSLKKLKADLSVNLEK